MVGYPAFHAGFGWVSEIKYELIAAARGAFHKLTISLNNKNL